MTIQHKNIADPNIHEPKGIASASSDQVYIADGAGSGSWSTVPGQGNNIVTVNSASDFPTAVAGVITLAASTTYQIHGNVSVGTDRIVFSAGSKIMGRNRFSDFLTYTGTGNLFTANSVNCAIEEMGIIASSGTVFNFAAATSNTFVATNSYIVTCSKVGTFTNWGITVFRSFSIVAATHASDGSLNFIGACTSFSMDNSLWQTFTAGTMIDFGTATFDRIQIPTGNRFDVGTGITGLSGLASGGNINAGGRGILTNNIFEGTGTYLSNIAQPGDVDWKVDNNAGVKNSTKNAQGYMHTLTTTTIGAGDGDTGNPKLINSSTNFLTEHDDQFTVTTGGRITYDGTDDAEFHVRCVINGTANSGTGVNYNHYIAKNGTAITASKITREYNSGSNGTGTTAAVVTLSNGDYIEVFVENISSTQNWDTNILNFIVSET